MVVRPNAQSQLMKAACVPILGILGPVIVNWDTKKKREKMAIFALKSY